MEYNDIYKKVESHVTSLFNAADTSKLCYHNLHHTRRVVDRVKEIAAHYNLIESDMLVLYVAAYFHDTGYLFTDPLYHEAKSTELMKEYMQQLQVDEEIINNIAEVIMATKSPIQPKNLLQQVMVDADTFNLGTKEIFVTNEQVYQEHILRYGPMSKTEWDRQTIKMLEKHQFFTNYCKELLMERKKKNIKKLKKETESAKEEEPVIIDKELAKANANLTSKGIQTMLRLTSENHMKLSDMADGKANILISVNSIIISVILSVLLRKLQTDTYLTIPTMIFLISSVTTIVIAILATRPKVNEGTFSEQDIANKQTNLLFFGNFYKTPLPIYENAMSRMMVDSEYLYGSLVKDIYFLGVVLARKYKLIRLAYNIFMIGIIASVIAFAVAASIGHGADGVITNAEGSPL